MAYSPDYRAWPAQSATTSAVLDAGLRAYMLRVYNWMASGLLLTGIVAYGIAHTDLIDSLYPVVRTPSGQLIHTAGASPGGWTVIAVYESQQGYEHFRDATLLPRLQQGIPGGFQTPPQETTFASHTFLK